MSTQAGPVVETVSRKRTVPPEELAKEKISAQPSQMPDFWTYMEGLTDDEVTKHVIYIYREDPKPSTYGGEGSALEKCAGYIALPDGSRQLFNSREDIEMAIRLKYGGKAFRFICKKDNQRMTIGKCMNEAPPKFPTDQPYAPPTPPNGQTSSDTVAVRAMETVANQNPQMMQMVSSALTIATDALGRAAQIVANTHTPVAPATQAPNAGDDLDRALRAAMIKKLLDPPPDPMESLKQFAALRELFTPPQNGVVDKLVTTALDRFMNPVAPPGGRTTLLDLGRELIPTLGGVAKEVMHDYRLSKEIDLQMANLQRGALPAVAAQPQIIPPPPKPAVAAAVNPQPAQPAVQQANGGPTLDWVCERIAKIIKTAEYPVKEAVDRVIGFLYDVDEKLVGLLLNPPKLDPRLAPGKEGLVQLFQYEPSLRTCMVNIPRVTEFIDEFLTQAAIAEAENSVGDKPQAPPPPAPTPAA